TAPSDVAAAGHQVNGLNHVALVVEDLDEIERRVRAAGFEPFSFGDYDPGRRFYFLDPDGVEFEIVSYAA
ncbi:MAG: VOC family protein, partial [Ilumatobacter sp.]